MLQLGGNTRSFNKQIDVRFFLLCILNHNLLFCTNKSKQLLSFFYWKVPFKMGEKCDVFTVSIYDSLR